MKKLKLIQYIPKEKDIKRLIRDYLTVKGWFHFNIQQSTGAHKGISDLIAIKDRRVLFIEVKGQSKRAKQSNHQIEFQKNIESQGGEYILVRCLEDLIEKGV
jgi:Holliday junction resolvase